MVACSHTKRTERWPCVSVDQKIWSNYDIQIHSRYPASSWAVVNFESNWSDKWFGEVKPYQFLVQKGIISEKWRHERLFTFATFLLVWQSQLLLCRIYHSGVHAVLLILIIIFLKFTSLRKSIVVVLKIIFCSMRQNGRLRASKAWQFPMDCGHRWEIWCWKWAIMLGQFDQQSLHLVCGTLHFPVNKL